MKQTLVCVALAALLGGLVFNLSADSAAEGEEPRSGVAELGARIAELKAMPKAARRATLKAMAPEDRRGLWFALRKSIRGDVGDKTVRKYSELEGTPLAAGGKSLRTKAIGTIAYDSDFPTLAFGGGAIIGNRFDTHTAVPVLASGTVSSVQALLVPGSGFTATTSNAGMVILGPQTTMGGAPGLFSTFTTASGPIATVTFAGLGVNYTGSSFFVLFADNADEYIPVFGTGTTLAQGHHGLVGYTGGMLPDITGTFNFGNALNAFIRATGNIVPVELMTFGIE